MLTAPEYDYHTYNIFIIQNTNTPNEYPLRLAVLYSMTAGPNRQLRYVALPKKKGMKYPSSASKSVDMMDWYRLGTRPPAGKHYIRFLLTVFASFDEWKHLSEPLRQPLK